MFNTLRKFNVKFNVIADGEITTNSDIDVAAYSAWHAMDVAAKTGAAICKGSPFVWVPTSADDASSLV